MQDYAEQLSRIINSADAYSWQESYRARQNELYGNDPTASLQSSGRCLQWHARAAAEAHRCLAKALLKQELWVYSTERLAKLARDAGVPSNVQTKGLHTCFTGLGFDKIVLRCQATEGQVDELRYRLNDKHSVLEQGDVFEET